MSQQLAPGFQTSGKSERGMCKLGGGGKTIWKEWSLPTKMNMKKNNSEQKCKQKWSQAPASPLQPKPRLLAHGHGDALDLHRRHGRELHGTSGGLAAAAIAEARDPCRCPVENRWVSLVDD